MDKIKFETFDEYDIYAMRTANEALSKEEMRNHALFGLSGECGELLSIYQKEYQGHSKSQEHIRKEVGDILWMLNEFCNSEGFSLKDAAEENIEKLSKRFPDGFEVDKSLNRKSNDI